MEVSLLGPVRAVRDGVELPVGGPRLKAVLARLALAPGRVVPTGTLIDDLWGAHPPGDAVNALHSLVSRLRKALGDPASVESHATGYRLTAEVDTVRFEHAVGEARDAARAGRHAEAAAGLRAALALWRGEPLTGIGDAGFAAAEVVRLTELRASAVEDRWEADILAGRAADVVADLRTAVAAQPLRERPAALLVRALGMTGQQAEALAAYDRVRRDLADQLGVEPSPGLRDLHLAVLRGELAPRRPPPLTSFVGRTAELARLRALLVERRLVTLVGPGGAGKTRLATVLADELDAPTPFVGLAGVRAEEDVVSGVLNALGGRDAQLFEAMPPKAALDRVVEVLSARPGVLVLDNCEHVVDAAAHLVDAVLARCPGLRVLATSREPLAITGEAVLAVGPLPEADALALFADRAASAGAVVEPDIAAEICRRLDGLPLALELAAARLRSMTPRQVAARLDDRFRLLTGGDRTALPRHRTLRAVVEWSWELLTAEERLLASRLSVFPGGATAESVAAVAGLPVDDVVYVLASLVEKSLVIGGEDRYRMLETVRAYAGEGLTAEVRLAFARHMLAFVTDAEPRLRRPDQVEWLGRLSAEHANLLAAVRVAVSLGEVGLACEIAVRATWFWVVTGRHLEAGQIASELMALPGDVPASTRATLAAYAAFGEFGGMPDREVMRGLLADLADSDAMARFPVMAMLEPLLASAMGDARLAEERLDRAAALADPWGRAAGLLGRAYLADNGGRSGDDDTAAAALAEFRALGDRWGQALSSMHIAEQHSQRGDHPAALRAHEDAVRLVAELGAVDEMVGALARLGVARARADDLAGAERDLGEALRLAEERGGHELAALARFWLASTARRMGDLDRAARLLDEGRAVLTTVDRPSAQWVAIHCCVSADLACATGDAAAAMEWLREAMTAMAATPDMPVTAAIADSAAHAAAAAGDFATAARLVGVGAAIRGRPDAGNPELAALWSTVDAELGTAERISAHDAGAASDQAAALADLAGFLGVRLT
ncbi:BTAD domain-containing putative transcriptional regulator [Actinokineospora sp. UTMC 2448]|uniref:BTAD domain-containing putative transcriptional regulator n=1 Tax=Actinokineospora sp. UTMC 2448 TaxID=2268449 RepID=UPI002164C4E6|nr:BTAD domain-containing putative transcriptional regulator [Actinokineospora sp. UTMC 2448]